MSMKKGELPPPQHFQQSKKRQQDEMDRGDQVDAGESSSIKRPRKGAVNNVKKTKSSAGSDDSWFR